MQNLIVKTYSEFTVLFLVLATLPLLIGCDGSSVANAVPRDGKFEPVFASDAGSETTSTSVVKKNNLKLPFFHDDHFACIEMAVSKIASHPDFAELDWGIAEKQLAELVGKSNSRLETIERAWVLLDREKLSLEDAANGAAPYVFVLEYFEPVNQDEVIAASKKMTDNAAVASFVSETLNDSQIALGDPGLVAKLKNGNGQKTRLAAQFSQLDLNLASSADDEDRVSPEKEVNGVLVIAPIRSLLKSIFGMAASFSPDAQKYAGLPDTMQRIDLQLSLTGNELLTSRIIIEDEDVAKELVKLINTSLNESAGGSSGSPLNFAGGQPEMMFNASSPAVFEEVGNDIRERGLLTVLAKDEGIVIKLERPKELKKLIAAAIEDGRQQTLVVQRNMQFNKIAAALKKYEEEYGCLPSSTSITGDVEGATKQPPHQFSWRVALLPMLGHQKLYEQFDFDQPWDSAANMKAAATIPDVFVDVDSENGEPKTRFHIPVGENFLYRDDRNAPNVSQISDRKSSTAIVIEGAAASAEIWTKPGGWSIDAVDNEKFGQPSENGVMMISAAFKTRIIKRDRDAIYSVLTTDGGETVTRKQFIENQTTLGELP